MEQQANLLTGVGLAEDTAAKASAAKMNLAESIWSLVRVEVGRTEDETQDRPEFILN
jgi:hypothetical protein